ncbi:MAG: single-stranded DNA-binding protein [Bacteroidetes bacterium]|nr:single-stranded DNA-binding protein [Bacteroidota bacterium]
MKNSVNSVRLIGNAGMNPEIRTLNNGKKVANLSLATTERYKTANGDWVENTDWHKLVVWGNDAAMVEKYVTRGAKLAIEGRLTQRDYVAKDGSKRYVTEVWVNELLLLNAKKQEDTPVADAPKEKEELPF